MQGEPRRPFKPRPPSMLPVTPWDSVTVLVRRSVPGESDKFLVQMRGEAMKWFNNTLSFPGGGVGTKNVDRACYDELHEECSVLPYHLCGSLQWAFRLSKQSLGWANHRGGWVHVFVAHLHIVPRVGIQPLREYRHEVNLKWGKDGHAWYTVGQVLAAIEEGAMSCQPAAVFKHYLAVDACAAAAAGG